MDLGPALARAAREFRAWDEARERLIAHARDLGRSAAAAIRDLHRGLRDAALWRRMDRAGRGVLSSIGRHPEFRHHGLVQQSLGEYAEAWLLSDLLRGRKALPPKLRPLPGDALVLGLADTIGELRRVLLDRVNREDWPAAKEAFDQMESLFGILCDIDAPEALVALRPKRDAMRALLERTRGDYVTSKKSKGLEKKIDDVRSLLDEAEGPTVRRPKRGADDDLDLDAAWGKN